MIKCKVQFLMEYNVRLYAIYCVGPICSVYKWCHCLCNPTFSDESCEVLSIMSNKLMAWDSSVDLTTLRMHSIRKFEKKFTICTAVLLQCGTLLPCYNKLML